MLRSWYALAVSAAFYLGVSVAVVAHADDRPAPESPPPAENILDEVVRQNSNHFAAPPSPTRRERAFPLQLKNVKVENRGQSQIRVKLPSNQAPLTPAVADGKIFVGGGFNSNEFYCLASDTGRPVWGLRLSDNGPSAPTYNRGTLSFTTESCTLYVVDAASGNCLWAAWLGDPLITAPTIAGDRVLVSYPAMGGVNRGEKPPANFVFAARDLRTGRPLWQKWIDENIISAPVVSGDDVYLTTFAGTLYGFRLESGEVELARRCRGTSAPIVVNKAIYLSRRVDKGSSSMPMECVTKLDRRTGEPLMASEARGAAYLADAESRTRLSKQQAQNELPELKPLLPSLAPRTPFRLVSMETAVPGDPNYVPGGTPEVADSRPDSIKLVGRTGAQELQRFDGARLAAMGGSLFNCMGGDLQSVDPRTGKVRWSINLSQRQNDGAEPAALPPVTVAGRLYVATRGGELLRVSPQDGSIDGRVALGAAAATQPVFDDGRIVVGTSAGELIMLKSKDHKLTGWNQWGGGATHSGIESDNTTSFDDSLFTDDGEPRAVLRTGRELSDATRAALRKYAKTSDKTIEKARRELEDLNHELDLDTALPQQQRETLKFALKRRLKQLDKP
jgi:outer membrane protein assembly factor BamB